MMHHFTRRFLFLERLQYRLKWRMRYSIALILLLSAPVLADERVIVWDRTYDQPSMIEMLQLALDKTADKTPYQLVRSLEMEQGRVIEELKKSDLVDVAAFAPTADREDNAIAVRIPVSKGLLGFRVCLIRAGEEGKFEKIHSMGDWLTSGLTIGQGTHWPDTPILESNSIKVVKSVRYKPLFKMLEKKRFDCFPRSVNEVLSEFEKLENDKLVIEQHLLFQYRLPTFFFVNKENLLLAKRIERGLKMAIEDGSFDELFDKYHQDTLKKLNISQRKIISLDNPFLSDETQAIVGKPNLWLDLTNLE